MAGRDARHGGGLLLRWLPVVLVLSVLVAAFAAYRFDLGPRWFGLSEPDPATDPAAVAPPEGFSLPAVSTPAPVATPVPAPAAGRVDPAAVRHALAAALRDRHLGRQVFALVGSLSGGAPVFTHGQGLATPASTMKLLTTTAALQTFGPEHTFRTSVVSDGRGRVVLVGGGDPYLASKPAPAGTYPARADVVTLARATATALRAAGRHRVRLGYDDTLFTGPTVNPHWPKEYIADGVVAPISPLWVDEGRPPVGTGRVADPAAAAAAAFAAALAHAGVAVVGTPRRVPARAGAVTLAHVDSAPLGQIVEEVLGISDNEGAEVLGHQVGLATTGHGSFSGGASGVLHTLDTLGVPIAGDRVLDGSGLSRQDRLDPATLLDVLRTAAAPAHPDLRSVVTGLPIAGFSGSLEYRFEDTAAPARGRVRAKTGTLTGVDALAGLATDLDGNTMVFVLIADRVPLTDTLDARAALDRLAAALGACHCGR